MNDKVVLKVSDLRKRFKIYSGPWSILKEWLSLGKRSYHKDFWALDGISLEVSRGEFIGIIGPNGAGKSTLLKVITKILQPTDGTFEIHGRVLSILELSGGTDNDLTGRENVIRSGQLMGFPDHYVRERIERIREFSELGDFFEQPLRTYSTGMRTRLSFSMFAFMDTDILILDEVLAVGDIFFKQKCFARLAELIEQGTAIILVTHSMGVIQRYCNRAILLNNGKKVFDGDNAEAIRLFMQLHERGRGRAISQPMLDEEGNVFDDPSAIKANSHARPDRWPEEDVFRFRSFPKLRGRAGAVLNRLAVLNDRGQPTLAFLQGERLHIYCEFTCGEAVESLVVNVDLRDRLNLLVHSKNSRQNHLTTAAIPRGGIVHYHQSITLHLAPGTYIVHLDCHRSDPETGGQPAGASRVWRLDQAFAITVMPDEDASTESLHGGICDLPGKSSMQVVETQP